VKARDKIPKDALDVPELIRAATDAIALVGAAYLELNMRRRDNIKPEFGNDADLSKQLRDLERAKSYTRKRKATKGMDTVDTSTQSPKALATSIPHVFKALRPLKI